MMMTIRELGNQMRIYRKEHGLTQRAFAQLAEISTWSVSRIERGKVDPRLSTVIRIQQVLKIQMQIFDAGWEYGPLIYTRGWVDVVLFKKLAALLFHQSVTGKTVFLNLIPANPPGKRVAIQKTARKGAILATVGIYPGLDRQNEI